MNTMKPTIPYIVTKESDDGTFEVGNHIILNNDGSISGIEAQGWITAEDVAEAIKGMEYEIDKESIRKKIECQNKRNSELLKIIS